MTRFAGWMLAGGLLLGLASSAQAQVVIGNPYTGPSISIGTGGYGAYGNPYAPAYANPAYSPYGYNSYGTFGPTTSYYNSGYSGYYAAPMARTYTTTTYSYPSYGYGGYGYPSYGYGGYGAYGRRVGIPGVGRVIRRW